jgi:hypothetical protein
MLISRSCCGEMPAVGSWIGTARPGWICPVPASAV